MDLSQILEVLVTSKAQKSTLVVKIQRKVSGLAKVHEATELASFAMSRFVS